MEEKEINIYLVQEIWLPDDFEKALVINGFYMFHHGTVDKVSDTNKEREEDPPFLQARRGYA
jgi:hypothetical protein